MSKEKLHIVKIGGKLINESSTLDLFLEAFVAIEGPKILVHGGGRKATELSQQLGVEVHMIDGRRITDKETLDITVMVYAGLINKNIIAKLQGLGVNAIGLSGPDGNVIQSQKRMIHDLDYGFVGDIKMLNLELINSLLNNDLCPVFSPITHDGKGLLLNTNADTIAAQLAIALTQSYEVDLSYCFEFPGVMKDLENSMDTYPKMTKTQFDILKEDRMIHSGMLPKLKNGFDAISSAVSSVYICGIHNMYDKKGATQLLH